MIKKKKAFILCAGFLKGVKEHVQWQPLAVHGQIKERSKQQSQHFKHITQVPKLQYVY